MTVNKRFKPKHKNVKRTAKATVFTHLFSIPKYKKELYLCFYPTDIDIDEKDIKTWTLSSVFTNIQINDLGLLIRDTLLVLIEAQSIWTLNILPRLLAYLAESYNRYLIETKQNIYGTKKVKLPKPELYVLYTGSDDIREKEISFRKEFFDGNSPIDIVAKVITVRNSSKILNEYIIFSKILDDNIKKFDYNKESIKETIKYCIEHDILKEYLQENQKEVYNIMTSIYDQETATYMYGQEQFAEGERRGWEKGNEEGKELLLVKQYKDNIITAQVGADYLNISIDDFLKLVK